MIGVSLSEVAQLVLSSSWTKCFLKTKPTISVLDYRWSKRFFLSVQVKCIRKYRDGTLIFLAEIHGEFFSFHFLLFSSHGSFDPCCKECSWLWKSMSSCACVGRGECFIHYQGMLSWVGEFWSKDGLHITSNRTCTFSSVYPNFNIGILT